LAASNRDLEAEVKKGRFREDLYYRLSVVNIYLPPLRERREDILYLARYFLKRFSAETGRGKCALSRQAEQAMQRYEWPGNVRELEHHVQRAVLLSSGRLIRAADLALSGDTPARPPSLRKIRDETDRSTIIEALRRSCGNISKAAAELEISRPSLHDLLRKHRIDAGLFKGVPGAAPAGDGE
jgi:two-component system NtrC family response regulator